MLLYRPRYGLANALQTQSGTDNREQKNTQHADKLGNVWSCAAGGHVLHRSCGSLEA